MKSWSVAAVALALVVGIAFHPLLLAGDTSSAVTAASPTGGGPGVLPVVDPGVAQLEETELWLCARAIRAHGVPAWSLHQGLGVPLGDLAPAGLCHPLRLLLLTDESGAALDLLHVARVLLAALGAFALALHVGARPLGAFSAGVLFGLSAAVTRQIHLPVLDGAVLLPWLCLAADLAARGGAGSLALFAGAAFLVVAGGGAELLPAAIATLLGWTLWRRRAWPPRARRELWLVAAAAAALAALAWLPRALAEERACGVASAPGFGAALAGVLVPLPQPVAHTASALGLALAWFGARGRAAASAQAAVAGAALALLVLGLAAGAGGAARAFVFPILLGLAVAAARGVDRLTSEPEATPAPTAAAPRGELARDCGAVALTMLASCGLGALSCDAHALSDWLPAFAALVAVGAAALLSRRRLAARRVAVGLAALVAFAAVLAMPLRWAEPSGAEAARPDWVRALQNRTALERRLWSTAARPTPADCVRFGLFDAAPPMRRTSARFAQFAERCAPALCSGAAAAPPRAMLDLLHVTDLVAPDPVSGAPRAAPRPSLAFAFFPEAVSAVDGLDAALDRVAASADGGDAFDAQRQSLLETADAGTADGGPRSGSAGLLRATEPGVVALRVQASDPAWLIVSLEPHPGLRATIDGAAVPIVPANAVQSAVRVPRGRHQLEFTHVLDPTGLCPWLAIAGALGLLALLVRRARNPIPAIDPDSERPQDTAPSIRG